MTAECRKELDRWEEKALRLLAEGQSLDFTFSAKHVPEGDHAEISRLLRQCETDHDIETLFESAEEVMDEMELGPAPPVIKSDPARQALWAQRRLEYERMAAEEPPPPPAALTRARSVVTDAKAELERTRADLERTLSRHDAAAVLERVAGPESQVGKLITIIKGDIQRMAAGPDAKAEARIRAAGEMLPEKLERLPELCRIDLARRELEEAEREAADDRRYWKHYMVERLPGGEGEALWEKEFGGSSVSHARDLYILSQMAADDPHLAPGDRFNLDRWEKRKLERASDRDRAGQGFANAVARAINSAQSGRVGVALERTFMVNQPQDEARASLEQAHKAAEQAAAMATTPEQRERAAELLIASASAMRAAGLAG